MTKTVLNPQKLVSWRPIAEAIGLKERAFWEAVYKQGLPHYKINPRVLRFRWCEVEKWLAVRRNGDVAT